MVKGSGLASRYEEQRHPNLNPQFTGAIHDILTKPVVGHGNYALNQSYQYPAKSLEYNELKMGNHRADQPITNGNHIKNLETQVPVHDIRSAEPKFRHKEFPYHPYKGEWYQQHLTTKDLSYNKYPVNKIGCNNRMDRWESSNVWHAAIGRRR